MEEVTEEMIMEGIADLTDVSAEEFAELVEKMGNEQPEVKSYLIEIATGLEDKEWEFLFYSGILIWLVMSKRQGQLIRITRSQLEEVLANNYQLVEVLLTSDDMENEVSTVFANYSQPSLLNFILLILTENPSLPEMNKPSLFLHLKTLIDCFDNAYPPQGVSEL